MKDYIYQFYNEGFATTFYIKPTNFINKKLKNKRLKKIILVIYKILYNYKIKNIKKPFWLFYLLLK